MSTRVAAILAIVGTAAAVALIKARQHSRWRSAMDIDDDSAAEIIKRALPALERALAVS